MSSLSILITSVLNSASDRLVISISFSSFPGVLLCSFIGPYFFVSLIRQPPCVCFCVLGRAALTPCLSSVAYYRRDTCKLCGALDKAPGWAAQFHCFVPFWGQRAWKGDNATAWPERKLSPWHLPPCQSLHFLHVLGKGPICYLPFQLLLWCWIPERVGLHECSVCCGPFERSLLRIPQFLPLPQMPLVFAARSFGDLSYWRCSPGLGGLVWGWYCLLLRYPSQFLSTMCECGTTSFAPSLHLHVSAPPTCLDECVFFKSLVVRLPYSLIFWQIWVKYVLYSSCNFCCICVQRWSMFTYSSTLAGICPFLLKRLHTTFFPFTFAVVVF